MKSSKKQFYSVEQWAKEHRKRVAALLQEEGYIVYDDYGQAHLTDKGKQRAAARLDKLPIGDDLLLEIAVCEAYSTSAVI